MPGLLLDFSRCRKVWIPDEDRWSPPPPHVVYGVKQIITHPYFLLADDMGAMKTAQVIIAAQFLHDADVIDRVIVIAPAAIRPKVWFDEDIGQLHEQVFDDKRNTVTEYHARKRRWTYGPRDAKELKWIISNYEFIRSKSHLAELLPYCGPRTMLILDESSAVKNHKSAQTDACMKLRWQMNARGRPVVGEPRCGRILELNGTPVAESPLDMFSQGNLLHPSILDCKYKAQFEGRYAVQKPGYAPGGRTFKQTIGWTNLADLQSRFAPYVLRREARDLGIDFALPPVGLEVTLTEKTWTIYKAMRNEMVAWLESGVATAHQAGVKAIRLAQITSGFLGGIEDANIGGEYEQGIDGADGTDREPHGFDGEAARTDDPFAERDSSRAAAEQQRQPYEQVQAIGDFTFLGGDDGTGRLQIDTERLHTDGSKSSANHSITSGDIEYHEGRKPSQSIQEIGREKLDFALQWHAELLARHPDLKLLVWCRFVPELKRYLHEEQLTFPSIPVGAACGQKIFDGEHGQKAEREHALRLLHPKTAPDGPVTVGATQGTGAMGLNFTACHTVLDMSYDFSPWKKKQGDARVNRPGQTAPVSFFYLIAVGPRGEKTIDHHVMMTRLGKAQINDWTTAAWVKALKEE